MAEKFGVYLEKAGITDRATILIDTEGIVRHASSVGPGGRRNIDELLALATEVNTKHPAKSPPLPAARKALSKDAVLYVREGCRFCAAVLRAAENLHCTNIFKVRDVTQDEGARRDLDSLAGEGAKVPALVEGGKVTQESGEIIRYLAEMYART